MVNVAVLNLNVFKHPLRNVKPYEQVLVLPQVNHEVTEAVLEFAQQEV